MAYRATDRTESHRLATRRRILDATLIRVQSGGFASIAMTAVADDAEVATGTLYRHFQNKAALCCELFRECSQREVDSVRRRVQSAKPAAQRLTDACRSFCARALRGRNLAYALIAEPLDPALEQERLNFRSQYAILFRHLLDEGKANGDFAINDSKITATALVGVLAETLVGPLAPTEVQLSGSGQNNLTEEICRLCQRLAGYTRGFNHD